MTLRTRLLLALLATSAVTLGVAALALLSPLQTRLRTEAHNSLRQTVQVSRNEVLDALHKDHGVVATNSVTAIQTLADRTNARVLLYRYPVNVDDPVAYDTGFGPTSTDDVFQVVGTGRGVISERDGIYRMAVPLPVPLPVSPKPGQAFILAVRRPDTQAQNAFSVVQGAFTTAAIISLVVAGLLGLGLSTWIARRLARLRRSALALAADGVGAAPPIDTGNDEVGDLARALASMQQALRRQEEARRAFVATASHELRTPLTSLQGNLELLAEDLEHGDLDVDDARRQLNGAQAELRRLGNLATELLDLSRLDAGVALRCEPVELAELSRAVAAEFALRARDETIDLEVVPPPGPVWASGDPGAIARVGRILLDNALRFSPEGDAVQVVAAYHGDRATLEVVDQGPGVPEHERELIFQRFQRGTRTGGESGFGLGLAIGRELARRMGGELSLARDGRAGGARFVLTLPIELPRGSGDGAVGAETADDDLGRVGDEAGGPSRI